MLLDWDTIRLLDDVNEGDCIEIDYWDPDTGRQRWTIGSYSHVQKDSIGEWALFLKRRYLGIRMIDVMRIEKVA
jgi:hypothetical protein